MTLLVTISSGLFRPYSVQVQPKSKPEMLMPANFTFPVLLDVAAVPEVVEVAAKVTAERKSQLE